MCIQNGDMTSQLSNMTDNPYCGVAPNDNYRYKHHTTVGIICRIT